ncbi:MAG TPA: argininosuccinate synthase [Candidatus Deferrimicrobium sp.]|nr:argininosuccinate synthase [Candidatus Deferrimicrobium sp.]
MNEKTATYLTSPEEVKLCVLLYSGGLDTSCMLKWIQEKYDCEMITLTLDVGQTKDFDKIEEKALKLGVKKHYTIDAKEQFAREYVFPALKANALYERVYPLCASLSRPLIATVGVEIAKKHKADAIAHGCTGKGNDQVRFVNTILSLEPTMKIIAPVVEWNMSRDEEIEYAKKHGIPIPVDINSPYSLDENLWGRSIESGLLEHPENECPADAYAWTVAPEKAPNTAEYITITFAKGDPIALNDEKMGAAELIMKLNEIGGKHGVGRLDHMEDRIVGLKSREVYETPGATILINAHLDLEKFVCTRHENLFKEMIDSQFAYLIYAGLWLEPLREDLQAFLEKVNEKVTGKVRLKLYKGSATVVGRNSDNAIYDYNLATYTTASTFNQKASFGFIELWGLQSKIAYLIKKRSEQKK